LKQIAIEKGLSDVSDYLKSSGYGVSEFDAGQKGSRDILKKFDAVILSGMDNDFMGIETTSTKVPVIIASGMRPEEIKARIDSLS